MGFLGKIVSKAIINKTENIAMHCVVRNMENTRSVDALVSKSTANYMLFIKKKSISIKRGFTVVDEFNKKKYVVKADALTFGYPCIRLYDTDGNEIGKVELAEKMGAGTYDMYLDGKKLGTLSRTMAVKIKLEISFNDWRVDGNFMQNSFTVTDKRGNIVMKFNAAFSRRDTYVLEMNNRENEIIGLLLVMAVEIAIHGKD